MNIYTRMAMGAVTGGALGGVADTHNRGVGIGLGALAGAAGGGYGGMLFRRSRNVVRVAQGQMAWRASLKKNSARLSKRLALPAAPDRMGRFKQPISVYKNGTAVLNSRGVGDLWR